MSKKRQPKRPEAPPQAESSQGSPSLPPANPPRKRMPWLIASGVLLVAWLGVLMWMAFQ